jgi:ribosome-binding factor A
MNVTVTEVRVSPDLRNATAFVTPLGGGGDPAETVAALRRAAPFFRSQVAKAMRLRHAPTIGFEPDTSFDYAGHIGTLLQNPDVRRDLGREPGGDIGRGPGGDIDEPEALEPGAEEFDEEEERDDEEGRDGGVRGA